MELKEALFQAVLLFYIVVSLAVPYALLYLIPFKLKFFKKKTPSEFWEEFSLIDRFSLAMLVFNFAVGITLVFFSDVFYCFFGVRELYPILRELSGGTTCFFLEHVVYGFLFLVFGYFALGLFRRAGFLFSFTVFLIALGGWVIMVSAFYRGG